MARKSKTSLADIESQIEVLQKRAAELRAAEVHGVIERIKVAVAHYGLTAEQLGFGGSTPASISRSAPAVGADAVSRPRAPKKSRTERPAGVAKYSDGQGKTWTGNGKRPGWFKDAIAAGKTPQELLIQA